MLLMGCSGGDPFDERPGLYFSISSLSDTGNYYAFEVGEAGKHLTLFVSLDGYYEPFRAKWHFSGPGALFEWWNDYADGTPMPTKAYSPIDTSVEYVDQWFKVFYMPPASNDELLASGTGSVSIVLSVLDPRTNKWVEAPEYARITYRVSTRYAPADYRLGHWMAGYDQESNTATVSAGEAYMFTFSTNDPQPGYDLQIQHGLAAQGSYTGSIGKLTTMPGPPPLPSQPPRYYTFIYVAPENIASPIDVTATVSYYDIWVQERRKFEFTLHVVP
jgi:hypothetical protein